MSDVYSKQQVLDAFANRDPRKKEAIRRGGLPAELQRDEEVVAIALARDATLFGLFEGAFDDESLVLLAIASTDYPHRVLERASARLRGERRVIAAALKRGGKFFGAQVMSLAAAVDPALGKDAELLDMAGLWTAADMLPAHGALLLACSVELAQDGQPTRLAQKFIEHLQAHPDVCNHRVFFSHSSPHGCCDTCVGRRLVGQAIDNAMQRGKAGESLGRCKLKCRSADTRHHLEAVATNSGVLVQLVEPMKNEANQMELQLGPCQAIDAQMARSVPLKVICVSLAGDFFTLVLAAVDAAMAKAREWRAGGCKDITPIYINHYDVTASLGATAFVSHHIFAEGRPLVPSGLVEKDQIPSASDLPASVVETSCARAEGPGVEEALLPDTQVPAPYAER